MFFYDNWHNEHKQQQSLEERSNINTDLAEFQSRLVRLLSSESLIESGLYLAQLPKEYEKNYQEKVPIPKDYGYRKLIQLLQNECPNICGYGYQTSLLIPSDDLVSYWLGMITHRLSPSSNSSPNSPICFRR